jgi:hypothetical protein
MGLGNSLNYLNKKYLTEYITIGVNDIQRMDITPNYLVFCNTFADMDKRTFDIENNRKYWTIQSKAEYIFTRKLNFPLFPVQSKLVNIDDKYDLIRHYRSGSIKPNYDRLWAGYISPHLAVSLGIWMGAKKVLIAGVDLDGPHCFGKDNPGKAFNCKHQLDGINADMAYLKSHFDLEIRQADL